MSVLDNNFLKYHHDNPQMYDAYLKYALELLTYQNILSISMIAERIRWESAVTGTGEFKVQNSYRAYYTRLLIWNNPEKFAGTFRTKCIPIDSTSNIEDPATWNQEYWSLFN